MSGGGTPRRAKLAIMSSGSQTPTCRVTACSRCRWAGPEQPEGPACFAAHGVQPHPRQYTVVVSGQGCPPEFPVAADRNPCHGQMRVPQSTVPVDRSAPECGRTPGPTCNPMPAVSPGDDLRSADAGAERAVSTDVVAGSERKPVPTGATGRDRFSAASMMPGCATRTVGRWRTPLQVIPRTQWAKGARHRTHLAYLVRLVSPAARTTQRVFENRQVRASRLVMVVIMARWTMASWWSGLVS